jgi:hypothetical protein
MAARERKLDQSISSAIQRTLGAMQVAYGRAALARPQPGTSYTLANAPNTFPANGMRFFVDQVHNNYIVPAGRVTGLVIRDGRFTALNEDVGGEFAYGKVPVAMARLKEILLALAGQPGGRPASESEMTMFLASMAAEPSRYSIAQITNLLALESANPTERQSAFERLSMTQGGTDPSEGRTKETDPNLRGRRGVERDMPKKVTDRDLDIVKNSSAWPQIQEAARKQREEQLLIKEIKRILKRTIQNLDRTLRGR